MVRLVNTILLEGIRERATDIHIEPYEKDLVVRYRIDGVLKEALRPPYKFKNTIAARIKIMAGLNIAEKRIPQDGRIRIRMAGREIDLHCAAHTLASCGRARGGPSQRGGGDGQRQHLHESKQ